MQTARDQNINSARLRLQQTTDIRRRVPEGFVGSDRELIKRKAMWYARVGVTP